LETDRRGGERRAVWVQNTDAYGRVRGGESDFGAMEVLLPLLLQDSPPGPIAQPLPISFWQEMNGHSRNGLRVLVEHLHEKALALG
jgi:hypothetical protein